MWEEYEFLEPVGPIPHKGIATHIYHHRSTGALSLDFPDVALAHCRGGILADDMGLGKTVMCLALCALDMTQEVPNVRMAAEAAFAAESAAITASGPQRL